MSVQVYCDQSSSSSPALTNASSFRASMYSIYSSENISALLQRSVDEHKHESGVNVMHILAPNTRCCYRNILVISRLSALARDLNVHMMTVWTCVTCTSDKASYAVACVLISLTRTVTWSAIMSTCVALWYRTRKRDAKRRTTSMRSHKSAQVRSSIRVFGYNGTQGPSLRYGKQHCGHFATWGMQYITSLYVQCICMFGKSERPTLPHHATYTHRLMSRCNIFIVTNAHSLRCYSVIFAKSQLEKCRTCVRTTRVPIKCKIPETWRREGQHRNVNQLAPWEILKMTMSTDIARIPLHKSENVPCDDTTIIHQMDVWFLCDAKRLSSLVWQRTLARCVFQNQRIDSECIETHYATVCIMTHAQSTRWMSRLVVQTWHVLHTRLTTATISLNKELHTRIVCWIPYSVVTLSILRKLCPRVVRNRHYHMYHPRYETGYI